MAAFLVLATLLCLVTGLTTGRHHISGPGRMIMLVMEILAMRPQGWPPIWMEGKGRRW